MVVSGGRILGAGSNRSRLNNSYVNWWSEDDIPPTTHAEVAALNRCRGQDLSNAVLYVSRVNRLGEELMSRPCPKCQVVIASLGISKIVYTINNQMELR